MSDVPEHQTSDSLEKKKAVLQLKRSKLAELKRLRSLKSVEIESQSSNDTTSHSQEKDSLESSSEFSTSKFEDLLKQLLSDISKKEIESSAEVRDNLEFSKPINELTVGGSTGTVLAEDPQLSFTSEFHFLFEAPCDEPQSNTETNNKKEYVQNNSNSREQTSYDQQSKEIPKILGSLTLRKKLISSDQYYNFLHDAFKQLQENSRGPITYPTSSEQNSSIKTNNLNAMISLYSASLCKGRFVTSLDTSFHDKDIICATYAPRQGRNNDTQGLLLVWNLQNDQNPEYTFESLSEFTFACFSSFDSSQIIVGSASGQVSIYDLHSLENPVLSSDDTQGGHYFPICDIKLIGTQYSFKIVTLSLDGTICFWDSDYLQKPQRILSINNLVSQGHELQPTTIDIAGAKAQDILVGAVSGVISSVKIPDGPLPEDYMRRSREFLGHLGPITKLSLLPSKDNRSSANLFLSSSLDWTVRLWKWSPPENLTGKNIIATEQSQKAEAQIATFEFEDMVLDISWHPNKLNIWGAVDASGKVSIWNMSVDQKEPILRMKANDGENSNLSTKLRWDNAFGDYIAVGDIDGHISIFDVHKYLVGNTVENENQWIKSII